MEAGKNENKIPFFGFLQSLPCQESVPVIFRQAILQSWAKKAKAHLPFWNHTANSMKEIPLLFPSAEVHIAGTE